MRLFSKIKTIQENDKLFPRRANLNYENIGRLLFETARYFKISKMIVEEILNREMIGKKLDMSEPFAMYKPLEDRNAFKKLFLDYAEVLSTSDDIFSLRKYRSIEAAQRRRRRRSNRTKKRSEDYDYDDGY